MAILNHRSLLLTGAVLALAQAVSSIANPNPSFHVTTTPSLHARGAKPGDPGCGFEGNADFYGIGVRLGFYFQWIAGLIAWVFDPSSCEELGDAQTIFLAANLIAALVLSVQDAANTNVVVIILLFYMFFGGSVSTVTSASASLEGFSRLRGTKKIAAVTRQVLVQLTFLAMLIFSFWFWCTGLYKFKKLDCGTYVFPIAERLSLKRGQGGSVLALVLLIVMYVVIWWVSLRRIQRNFRSFMPEKVAGYMTLVGTKVPGRALNLSTLWVHSQSCNAREMLIVIGNGPSSELSCKSSFSSGQLPDWSSR